MYKRTCKSCSREFKTQKAEAKICYGCALEQITGGQAPEEGDINSALLISGEMSDKEARWLQEYLESVDHAKAESDWSRMVEDDDFDRWSYLEEERDEE